MKTYLALTAVVFGAVAALHLWRAVVEPDARNPLFYGLTVLAAALCVWAAVLWRRAAQSGRG